MGFPALSILTAHTTRTVRILSFGALALTGCRARELGANISPTQAASVDPSWITAAQSCWPSLAEKSKTYISTNLQDPLGFRSTFPAYATLVDSQLEKIVAAPVLDAPSADPQFFSNSTSRLLTRQQALSSDPHPADIRDTKNPDVLCVIHSGTPAGYR